MNQKFYILALFSSLFFNSTSYAQIKSDSLNAATPSPEIQFQDQFYEGLKQKGIEKYSKAIDNFIKCVKLFPDRAVIYYELGDLYFRTKQYGRAESNLQKAIDLDAENFWYKEKLYHLYVDQNNFDKAIQAVKPLLFKGKDYEEDLANLYASAGRFEEAIEQIEALDQRYGYNPYRDQTRIEIYKQTSNPNGHITFLEHRLDEAPENPQNFLNLIYTLSQYDLKDKAFSTAKLFLKQHPKSHIVHVALYKFYLDAKAYDNAITSMKIVTESNVLAPHLKVKVLSDFMLFVQENPQYSEALINVNPAPSLDTSSRTNEEWARYYEQENQTEKALDFYEKALAETPENLQLAKSLAKLYFKSKHYERTVEFTLLQLELFPTQIEFYLICGQAQLTLQHQNEALKILEMGVDYIFEEDEITAAYYQLMADLYRKNDNIEKADAFSHKAKTIQSKK